MVADALIYHPAVSHYLKYVATTVGRDKLLRTLQYFARFYAWYLLRTNRPQTSIQPWEAMKKQFGLVRKVLRAGKNVEHFKAAAVAADAKTMDPVLRYTTVGRQLGYAGYLSMDLLTLLDATGIKKSPNAKRFQQEAYRFWAVGLACSVLGQLYTQYQLRQREARVDRKEGEGVLESKRIAIERTASRLQLTSDLCDLTVPLSALNWVAFDDGIVGLAGTLSSLIGVYLQWKKTAAIQKCFITRPSWTPANSMKPNYVVYMASPAEFEDLGLAVLGVAAEYPPHSLKPSSLEVLSKRFYPDSPAMQKVLSINRYTGIDQRSSIGTPDHPLVNDANPPSITDLHNAFMEYGVPLAVNAARKALTEAHVDAGQVTHMVSTTCTNSANPGYDHFVAKELGLSPNLEKVLLHGVGCSGGLAALRTAADLCLGHTMRRKPARILVVALEISTTLVRSELESINALQETRIGVALFSDCAGALVLSNNIHPPSHDPEVPPPPPPIYTLLGWHHHTIPETESDLGFDVDPLGWKVVLSPRVPALTQSVLSSTFTSLMSTVGPLYQAPPADFDWAMHPGGATILSGAERVLGITPEHMRASYDTYINHGNSSSATILSVLDRLRMKDMDALAPGGKAKEYVVGCAFGPGISVEMCLLRRNLGGGGGLKSPRPGMETPPETESEGGGASEDGDGDVGSEGGEMLGLSEEEAGVEQRWQEDGDEARSVRGRVRADEETFISQALEGVELD
ncbi:peroxisomal biogenesis factor 11-domain-containing protein [Chaetomium strumarium]|uniref:Peroxisomal biogenesis factor 11-domain-containing protein n=1 Tax=Chaetomium strumarium TaxID=1170767 RepID=A0AAJ0LZB8_9PEZI|nr:peroxisomal biogenesis factor 11-domain-containing protein [Chaetomium strumarium]